MATIQGSTKQQKVSIKEFKGMFESPDGDTQLKYGIATEMRNFCVSETYHLVTRPGILCGEYNPQSGGVKHQVCGMWSGWWDSKKLSVIVWTDMIRCVIDGSGAFGITTVTVGRANVFDFGGKIYMQAKNNLLQPELYRLDFAWDSVNLGWTVTRNVVEGYVPLVVTGAAPSGGGTSLERVNLLTGKRRISYSADGTSADYILPEKASAVHSVIVDNVASAEYTVPADGSKVVFNAGHLPPVGINNVEITYTRDDTGLESSNDDDRALITGCMYCEAFNGSTDNRMFFYGDGSNICYYSGITQAGEPTVEYFPALNEIAIGSGNSPIMAMGRHYTRLMVFKPDCTYAISYDTIYLADGLATSGFYLRPMNRELGSDCIGRVVTCDNFLRTICRGNLYEWKQTASYYQDERYARIISGPVRNSFLKADTVEQVFLFDDDRRHRMYAFLNDNEGTVLVNDYQLDVWYKWTGFRGVYNMMRGPDDVLFFSMYADDDTDYLCSLDEHLSYDYIIDPEDSKWHQKMIDCYWESGHMAFGSESTRKYSSYVWCTLLAGPGAVAVISARTDRKSDGPEKTDWANTTGLFDAIEFDRFSFVTYLAPFARRLKLKLKKFVYYKLIIQSEPRTEGLYEYSQYSDLPENDGGGGAMCVLNIDIKIRPANDAK